jgi:diguanylate cyclase (GGDEF)-like protein
VGGEEFAWILPDADGLGAYAAVERARAAISAVPFPDVGSLTISAGICERAEADGAEQMYARADKALYWAKHHGRNQTFTYTALTAAYLAGDDPLRRTLSS